MATTERCPPKNPEQASRYSPGGQRSVVATHSSHTMTTTERCPPKSRSKLRGIHLEGNALSLPHARATPWQRRSVALQKADSKLRGIRLEGNALSLPHTRPTPWQRRSVALQQSQSKLRGIHLEGNALSLPHTRPTHHGNDGALPSNKPGVSFAVFTWRATLCRCHTLVPHTWQRRSVALQKSRSKLRGIHLEGNALSLPHARCHTLVPHNGNDGALPSKKAGASFAVIDECPAKRALHGSAV